MNYSSYLKKKNKHIAGTYIKIEIAKIITITIPIIIPIVIVIIISKIKLTDRSFEWRVFVHRLLKSS